MGYLFFLRGTVFVLVVLIVAVYWFEGINKQNLQMDEVVWVLDTDHYYQWIHGNRNFFQEGEGKSWEDPKFRILDQPFLGKAIFGWYLERAGLLNKWSSVQAEELYSLFPGFELPVGKPPQYSRAILSDEVVDAILALRLFNSLLGFLVIIAFAVYMSVTRRSFLTGIILVFFATLSPLVYRNFHWVLTNGLEIGFAFASLFYIYKSFSSKINFKKQMVFSFLAGLFTALSVDIKINTSALIVVPVMLFIFQKKRAWNYFLGKIIIFVATVFVSLWIIDPVFQIQGVSGLWSLFHSRILQQQLFVKTAEGIPLLETPWFLVTTVFNLGNVFVSIIFAGLVILGVISLLKSKSWRVLTVCSYFILVNLMYLTAGKTRYALESFFVCLFLSAYSAFFLQEKLRILRKYILN